jgi:CRISPR-associated protein Csx14
MKRVLLAVCGLSPQVITETLYALHHQGRMVDALRIITTREGKEVCLAQLLSPHDGQFYQFLQEYEIAEGSVEFQPRHILSVTDDSGAQIEDITQEQENAAFLEKCMQEAFYLTQESENEVYFSLAGGRKTMGACLALAAQFYARRQDRIFHVLVSPPAFENSREFFFPPKIPKYIRLFDRIGQELYMKTDNASVSLCPCLLSP